MTTTWTIAIDWDRDGEFTEDEVTKYTVWINWFLEFRKLLCGHRRKFNARSGAGQPRPSLFT